jgi:hydroxymethylpyrimidine pyrophosphatase-like HAD family hydrolase
MIKIAIDLDNTITASRLSIKFFSMLTNLLSTDHHITILTNREPKTEKEIAAELNKLGISYSSIIITADKADYIMQNGIEVFVEDTDEYFIGLPCSVLVFKIREDGNFDYLEKKWIGGKKTVRMIDE